VNNNTTLNWAAKVYVGNVVGGCHTCQVQLAKHADQQQKVELDPSLQHTVEQEKNCVLPDPLKKYGYCRIATIDSDLSLQCWDTEVNGDVSMTMK
jgi:hypothetical protein